MVMTIFTGLLRVKQESDMINMEEKLVKGRLKGGLAVRCVPNMKDAHRMGVTATCPSPDPSFPHSS